MRWHYRVRLADSDAADRAAGALVAAAQAQFPDAGWEARTNTNASPQLERNIERFLQYLTLVGLTALLVGGVGVANAVKSHLDRKRDVIATMKSLGATGGRVFAIYLAQVLLLALIGAVDRAGDRRELAVPDRLGLRHRHPACRSSRPCSRMNSRPRSSSAC